MEQQKNIIVFTDGSSRGNPGPGGWGTIVALPEGFVMEKGAGEDKTTNNRMELSAVIAAFELIAGQGKPVTINTDSQYVINGITKWVKGWERNGWVTQAKAPVLNKDLWQKLAKLTDSYAKEASISYNHIPAHVGVPGNERADSIATAYADKIDITMYEGTRERYSVDLTKIGVSAGTSKSKSKSKKGGKAYVYVSLVEGEYNRHHDWPSCQARVEGRSGVKYKKALSPEHEEEIKKEWGV